MIQPRLRDNELMFGFSSRSATGHLLQSFWVPGPFYLDRGRGAIDFTEIVGREFDRNRSKVFFQAMQLRRPGNWNDPRPLRKQPSDGNLSRCRLLPFCDVDKQINQGLIRFSSVWRKARDDVAEIGAIELRTLGDLAREKALTERAKWNESDPELFEGRQHFLFRTSPPQRVFALNCRDRQDSVCATDCLHSWFRKAEVFHLTLLNEVLHRSRHVFDRHIRINTVLIKQINGVDLQSFERA